MKGNQIKKVATPTADDDAITKNSVSDLIDSKNAFHEDKNAYKAKGAILLGKNKLEGLKKPGSDYEAATKKYVDDIAKETKQYVDEQPEKYLDEYGNIFFERNVDFKEKKTFFITYTNSSKLSS